MPWLPQWLADEAMKQCTRQARVSRAWMDPRSPLARRRLASTPLQMDTAKAASVPATLPVPARNVPFVPISPVEGLPRTTICTNFVRCCPRLARYRVTKRLLESRTAWDKETARTGPCLRAGGKSTS